MKYVLLALALIGYTAYKLIQEVVVRNKIRENLPICFGHEEWLHENELYKRLQKRGLRITFYDFCRAMRKLFDMDVVNFKVLHGNMGADGSRTRNRYYQLL